MLTVLLASCSHHKASHKEDEVLGLPANYPAKEVPVVPGQVMNKDHMYDEKEQTWDFTVIPHGHDVLPHAKKLLIDAGFHAQPPNAAKVGRGVDIVMAFWSSQYIVNIGASTEATSLQVHYLVTRIHKSHQ